MLRNFAREVEERLAELVYDKTGRATPALLEKNARELFDCPHCGAQPKQPCRINFLRVFWWGRNIPHKERLIKAMLVFGFPVYSSRETTDAQS